MLSASQTSSLRSLQKLPPNMPTAAGSIGDRRLVSTPRRTRAHVQYLSLWREALSCPVSSPGSAALRCKFRFLHGCHSWNNFVSQQKETVSEVELLLLVIVGRSRLRRFLMRRLCLHFSSGGCIRKLNHKIMAFMIQINK